MIQPALAFFNHVLNQHPVVRAELAQFAGRRVALSLPPLTLSGVVTDDGCLAYSVGEPEATVRVKPVAALLAQAGRTPSFSDLDLLGDVALAQCFGRLVGRLRWFPVEDLSDWVGDIAAHRIEGWVRRAVGFKGAVAMRTLDSGIEYLRDEAPLMAHKRDVKQFVEAVDILRDDVARLEKRLARLEAVSAFREDSGSLADKLCG